MPDDRGLGEPGGDVSNSNPNKPQTTPFRGGIYAEGDMGSFWNALDQPVVQSLVLSLEVIVLDIVRARSPEMPLAEDHQPAKTLSPHPS